MLFFFGPSLVSLILIKNINTTHGENFGPAY